jgi:hypothetical protein
LISAPANFYSWDYPKKNWAQNLKFELMIVEGNKRKLSVGMLNQSCRKLNPLSNVVGFIERWKEKSCSRG